MKPVNEWNLSAREAQVLDAWTEVGCSKLVADRLGLSINTLETHKTRIKRKSQYRIYTLALLAWDRSRRTGDRA